MEKIKLPKEEKEQAMNDIKRYFLIERDEEIGDLSAGLLLDYITDNLGPLYYNQALRDAYAFMNEKIEDLFGLEKCSR